MKNLFSEKNENFPFFGAYTALATPFKTTRLKSKNAKFETSESSAHINDELDLDALEKIVNAQICGKVDGLVLFGSTGEHFSLTESEKKLLFFTVKEITRGALPLICGVGSPSTKIALREALLFKSYGANGLLVLPPFYYKCADNGLIAHFFTISSSAKLPTIAYNVPARTGVDFTKSERVLNALYSMPNLAAIKQAEPDKTKTEHFIKNCKIPVLCGADENTFISYLAGAKGVISVTSNLFPKAVKQIYELFFSGQIEKAREKDKLLTPIYQALAIKSNPIPLKYALSEVFGCEEKLRLPLTELEKSEKTIVLSAIKNYIENSKKEKA